MAIVLYTFTLTLLIFMSSPKSPAVLLVNSMVNGTYPEIRLFGQSLTLITGHLFILIFGVFAVYCLHSPLLYGRGNLFTLYYVVFGCEPWRWGDPNACVSSGYGGM